MKGQEQKQTCVWKFAEDFSPDEELCLATDCGHSVNYHRVVHNEKYCRHCGRKVEWDKGRS